MLAVTSMMKIHLVYMTIWSLSQAAYISRMAVVRPRAPAVFRPGVMLQRPWHQRILPATYRAPYVVYRGPMPHRYAVKPHLHFRNPIPGGPWKTGRPPLPAATDHEHSRAASAPPILHTHGDTGAIHTIPAPNLSLSEKPIVVVDTDTANTEPAIEPVKTTYEVTEKYSEPQVYQMPAKIEAPTGFSKQVVSRTILAEMISRNTPKDESLKTPELQQFVQNGASFPLSAQYGQPSLPLPQNPQRFSIQGFTDLSGHQDLLQTAAEGIIIPPSALYQNDPNFLQKLQNQLLQQFPAVEFIPYTADVQPQIQQTTQSELFLLENEVITQQTPISFKSDEPHRNIVQRETQEASLASLMPQAFTPSNITENVTDPPDIANYQQNVTETVSSETDLATTTVKHIVETTTEQSTTPIYYAQVGQSVGNIIAKGFYSAINDVRAAAALAQVEKVNELAVIENVSTTIKPETVEDERNKEQNLDKDEKNVTSNEIKHSSNEIKLAGAPFEKAGESVNFTYRLLRSQDDSAKNNRNGDMYAGQLVQAMISEDRDFNKGRGNIVSWRPPLSLFAVPEKKVDNPQKLSVVKAKIPPKSKLTFDDKTGEPILRIYASYSENPIQKELVLSKLSNIKHVKEAVIRKQDSIDSWKTVTPKPFEKTIPDAHQISQFGLKLRSRSDDYIPLFEEYEE